MSTSPVPHSAGPLPTAGLSRRSLLLAGGAAALGLVAAGALPASAAAGARSVSASGYKLRVGARVKGEGSSPSVLATAFREESAANGGWDITRSYHGTLPMAEQPITPAGGVDVISYKTPQTHLAAFVRTMREQDLIAWHHEPEGESDGFTPESYRAAFVREYATAHQSRPSAKFGMISGGFQWRDGNRAIGGGFLPPKGKVDWLGFDTYRTGSGPRNAVLPLRQITEFQNWYAIAKTYGVPLYVTEYGRGRNDQPGAAAERPVVIRADYDYLCSLRFAGWVFWYPDRGDDTGWRFTDRRSIAAMRAVSSAA